MNIKYWLLDLIRGAVGYYALQVRLNELSARLESLAATQQSRDGPEKVENFGSVVSELRASLSELRTNISELRRRQDIEWTNAEDRDRDIIAFLLRNHGKSWPQLRIESEHPVAIYSDDHKFPRGTRNDNTRHPRFVKACERIFNRKVRHMDLGCAGGGLVWDFLIDGHLSVGVEGSDYSYLEQRAEWRTIPDHLFTADITKPFCITDDKGTPLKFDVITAWEVLEHIPEDRISSLIDNIVNHLDRGGLFVASIATFEDRDPTIGAVWHVTVKPREWWHERFASRGLVLKDNLFRHHDYVRGSGNPRSVADWDGAASPEMGFHIVYQRA